MRNVANMVGAAHNVLQRVWWAQNNAQRGWARPALACIAASSLGIAVARSVYSEGSFVMLKRQPALQSNVCSAEWLVVAFG